jgi:multidrug resistance efflux pump
MRVEKIPGEEPVVRRKSKAGKSRRSPTERVRDRVEISSLSKDGQGKFARVRRLIKEGVYSRPSFTEAIAEKLMDSDAMKKSDGNVDKSPASDRKSQGVPEERRDKIENARRKVRSGNYLTSRVLDKIVSRMIGEIGAENDSE